MARNRHTNYRRSVYRRRSIGTVLIVLSVVLVVLVIAFVVIGNILNKQSKERGEGTSDTESSESSHDIKKPSKSVNAYPVLLETNDSTVFSQRLDSLIEAGVREFSVPLNTKDGTLLYRSSIASPIGFPSGNASVSITGAMEKASERGVYVSGVFYLTAFSTEDTLVRSVELSRASAIVSEAIRAGMDDVLLIAPDMTADDTDELSRFVDDVRALADGATVGLTVPSSVFEAENASEVIIRLSEAVDYLALDATESGENDPKLYIEERISNSGMLFYIHMYNMRVLIPSNSDTNVQNEYISALGASSINNWQLIIKQ